MNQVRDISIQIYQTLRDRILDIEYIPGTPICEADICEEFQASRTPVRTAMQRLSDKGLIDILPYQKSRVSLIDLESVKQLVYARTAIEDRLLSDFINLDNELLVEDVDHLIRKQQIVLSQQDFKPADFYALDAAMHKLWYSASGNEGIWDFIQNSVHYTRMRMLDIKEQGDYESIIKDHVKILELIKAKDTTGLCEIMDSHLSGGIVRLSSRMDTDLSGYFA